MVGPSAIENLDTRISFSLNTRMRATYRSVGLTFGVRRDYLTGKYGVRKLYYQPFSFQVGWVADVRFRKRFMRLEYMYFQPSATPVKEESGNLSWNNPVRDLEGYYHVHGLHLYFWQRSPFNGGGTTGFLFLYRAAEEFTGEHQLWFYYGLGIGVEVGTIRPKQWLPPLR